MAGRGPAPKPAGRRARRNQDATPTTILRFEQADQPELPELPGGEEWCERTRAWWDMWGKAPQSELFSSTDWEYLMTVALIHHDIWAYMNLDRMQELRISVAKFGATIEDRARLRMQFAEADEADARRPEGAFARPSSRERAQVVKLKTVDGARKSS